jgi:hypothetical protein
MVAEHPSGRLETGTPTAGTPPSIAVEMKTFTESLATAGFTIARCLAVLVGNTREAWPYFKRWLAGHGPAWVDIADPFDTFAAAAVSKAVSVAFPERRTDTFWAPDVGDRLVCLQRLAAASGVARLEQSLHLNLHPVYGPWVSWRAVVVVDCDPGELGLSAAPPPPPVVAVGAGCLADASDKARAAYGVMTGDSLTALVPDPVSHLPTPVWRLFLAVRDAVHPNHPWRFGADQIEYHYSKNRAILSPA